VVHSLFLLHSFCFVLGAQRSLYGKAPLAYALSTTGLRVKIQK
jgi:hypothetical protein